MSMLKSETTAESHEFTYTNSGVSNCQENFNSKGTIVRTNITKTSLLLQNILQNKISLL